MNTCQFDKEKNQLNLSQFVKNFNFHDWEFAPKAKNCLLWKSFRPNFLFFSLKYSIATAPFHDPQSCERTFFSYEFMRLYCPIFSLYSINSYYYIKIQPKSYRGDRGGRGGRGGGRGRGDFSSRVSFKSLLVTQFDENTPNTI